MGRPKSAVFRTADLVGLDTFVHVSKNCYDTLPKDDERETLQVPGFLEKMVEKGMLGDKIGRRLLQEEKGDGGKEILVLDLKTFEYRAQDKVRFESLGAARRIEDLGERVADRDERHRQGGEVRRDRSRWTRWPTPRAASARSPTTCVNVDRAHALGLRAGTWAPSRPGTRTA